MVDDHEHHSHQYESGHEHMHDHAVHEHAAAPNHSEHAQHGRHAGHTVRDFSRRFWISLVLTVPILFLSHPIQQFLRLEGRLSFPGDSVVLFLLSSAVYFYGGWPFLVGFVNEMNKRLPGMMTLVALAITVSYAYSVAVTFGLPGMVFYWELATLIVIMLLGHWIEMRFVVGASRALQKLVELIPAEAHVKNPDGSLREIAVKELRKGDLFVVKPGERFPTDGEIVEGKTSVNESMLTGESRPVQKDPGDNVIAGSLNGDRTITVRAEKLGRETFISQVVEMVRQAQESKSRTQALADRAAFWLTVTAVSVGAVTLIAWLAAGREFSYALERTVTVMVITCPHALGLAVPLVIAISTGLAAGHGLLIRNRAAFEAARLIDAVVFDKTGTLTLGEFGVQAVVPLASLDETELLRLAASVESGSEHPIAGGIIHETEKRGISYEQARDFQAIKGRGASGVVGGRTVVIASPGYLDEKSIPYDKGAFNAHLGQGRTVVFVLLENKPVGAIALGDTIRTESKAAVSTLKSMGIKTIMLTGDNRGVAEAVSNALGLDEFYAEVLPDGKAGKIRDLMAKGYRVAMAGDGINDAPALATAQLGIAIGAGTAVAIETADIVLVRSNPLDIVAVLKLARATYRKMIQNLAWATGYNVVAIPLAAGVLAWAGITLSPAAGAVLMSASTIIVAINARFLSAVDQGKA